MEPEKKSNGALIGIIVIIILLLAGGIYVWQSQTATEPAPSGTLEGQVVEPSDEADLNSLESELEATDTSIEANVIESVE